MALVQIPGGGVWIPRLTPFSNATPTMNSQLLAAAADRIAITFQVPKDGVLDQFEFRLGTVTQAPASGIHCSIQDLTTAAAAPDGTEDQFRVVTAGLTSNTWVAPGLITSDGTDTGTKRTVQAGEILAAVLRFQSFAGGDSLNISSWQVNLTSDFSWASWVARSTDSGSTYTISANTAPLLALKYNDGTYAYLDGAGPPATTLNNVAFNNGSTPDERGLILRFPMPVQVSAVYARMSFNVAARDAEFRLYDSDGTSLLGNATLIANWMESTGGRYTRRRFASDIVLAANTNYRATLLPTQAGSINLFDVDVNTAAILGAMEGGTAWHFTSRTDAGAWSETTTNRPLMGLLLTAIEDGTAINSSAIFGGAILR
jgi:hypothetical protein